MDNNVVVLWDIENVTPPSSNNLFLQGLWDYAETLGKVVAAYAYADWSKPGFRKIGPSLASFNFTMLHIPYKKKSRIKNGADMQLVSDTMDLLHHFEHINVYLLVTGDSDFRPLLRSLRKSGKDIHIVCDFKTAAQDLLDQADSFKDYREMIPDNDSDDDNEKSSGKHVAHNSREYWYERLAEAAAMLHKENKSCNMGSAKIKMKMLNRGFNEKKLGFKQWGAFIGDAVKKGYVYLKETDSDAEIFPGKGYSKDAGSLQMAFKTLIQTLTELDGNKNPQYHPFSLVNSKLKEKGIEMEALGFSKFKLFASSAEARSLVDTKTEDFINYMKRQ